MKQFSLIPFQKASGMTWLLMVMLLMFSPSATWASEDQDDWSAMLERVDNIRFPEGGYQVDVTITTTEQGGEPDEREYRIISKGNSHTLVQTMYPEDERGQILLMRGKELWAFLPSLSQPVRLPLSQRLTGQVANGDLARAGLSGDYEASLARREKIDGIEYAVLQLSAADNWVTYRKALLWVHPKSSRPLKAEYYSASGRLLKTCHFQNYRNMSGAMRPTKLVIEDALRPGNRSVLEYRDMVERDLPDKIFTKDYLKKLAR